MARHAIILLTALSCWTSTTSSPLVNGQVIEGPLTLSNELILQVTSVGPPLEIPETADPFPAISSVNAPPALSTLTPPTELLSSIVEAESRISSTGTSLMSTTSETGSTTGTVSSATGTSSAESGNNESNNNEGGGGGGPNVGAIAGGVVGGLAVIGITAVAIVYIRRRNPKAPKPETSPETGEVGSGTEKYKPAELDGNVRGVLPQELEHRHGMGYGNELQGNAIAELPEKSDKPEKRI